jgi:hypothetical protein
MIKTILLDDIEAKLKRRIGRDQTGKMIRLKMMKNEDENGGTAKLV